MGRYRVGRKSISRDFEVIGEEFPVVLKQGFNGGYFLMDGVGKYERVTGFFGIFYVLLGLAIMNSFQAPK